MTGRSPRRLGADIGGTFTDLVLIDDETGNLQTLKVPTARTHIAGGVLAGIENLLARDGVAPAELTSFVHGTTLATNTVIEGTGSPVGLLVTRGTRDILELGRLRLPDPTNFFSDRATPLVPRARVREIRGRLYASGIERDPLSADDVIEACESLVLAGASAIAICFLHSYLNPQHELEAAEAIRRHFPQLDLALSSEVWPQQREYERALVTVINAMLLNRIDGYLSALGDGLALQGIDRRFLCTKSNGGVMSVADAAANPVQLLLSGPAAGVVGAHYLAGLAGESRLLTLDIGGTSADVSVLDGEVSYSSEGKVGDYPVVMPTVDILAIGAGGGSLARVDDVGVLKVGPSSAGSEPGPASYGRGGLDATVTDAYVATGLIAADRFLGGTMPLDATAATNAISRVGFLLGLSTAETASAILDVATAAMHAHLLPFLTGRGVAARDLALYAYGGAGPTHAFLLARELGVGRVLVPPSPGALCAIGCLVADLRADFIQSLRVPCTIDSLSAIRATIEQLGERGRQWVAQQATAVEDLIEIRSADMRYVGQSFDISVPLGSFAHASDIREAFERAYEAVYFHRNTRADVEVVNVRVQVLGMIRKPKAVRPTMPLGARRPIDESRDTYIDGAWTSSRVLDRYALRIDDHFEGPAVIEQYDTTVFVPPGFEVYVDDHWNLVGTETHP